MSDISIKDMIRVGAHYGHRTRYWSPKMAPFLYGIHNKTHIFNLDHTKVFFEDALNYIGNIIASNGTVMFVGTKRQAKDAIQKSAKDCSMPYVCNRWLGGMMTNFKTIKQSIKRLKDLETMFSIGADKKFNKKEALMLKREQERLEHNLGGIKDMQKLPDVVFIVDIGHEKNAVAEANKLGIATVAIVDSNHSPDNIDYVIPANDDASSAIEFYTQKIADAIKDAKIVTASKIESEKQSPAKKTKTKEVVNKKEKVAKKKIVKEKVEIKEQTKKTSTIEEKKAKNNVTKKTIPEDKTKTKENKKKTQIDKNKKEVSKPTKTTKKSTTKVATTKQKKDKKNEKDVVADKEESQ
jgi:small subunit ribosomal protein S2